MWNAWGIVWGDSWADSWGPLVTVDDNRVDHRRYKRHKHYAKAYLKRENDVLVFNSETEKEQFLEAEEEAKKAINRAVRRKVIAARPKPVVVDIDSIAKDADIGQSARQDLERLIYAYIEQMQADEDDIEALLLA